MKHFPKALLSLAFISCLQATWATPEIDLEKADIALEKYEIDAARKLLIPLAKENNARAMYLLAYAQDFNWSQDAEDNRLFWLKKAADLGYTYAQFDVALNKLETENTPIPDEVLNHLLELADAGEIVALFKVMAIKWFHSDKATDFDIDFDSYNKKAAIAGIARAQKAVSENYGAQDNAIMSIFWARKKAIDLAKLAKRGYVVAQFSLGQLYENGERVYFSDGRSHGIHSVEESVPLSIYWYEKAAQKHFYACEILGNLYSENPKKAAFWFERAVELGNIESAKSLLNLYGNGDQGLDKDIKKAKKYQKIYMDFLLEKLAKGSDFHEANAPELQIDIGREYANAPEGLRDFVQAEQWFNKANNQGYSKAMIELGKLYLNENNPNRDFTTAKKWLEKAAEQGDEDAMFQLGEVYFEGTIIPQDLDSAKKWFEKSVAIGKNTYLSEKRLEDISLYKQYQHPDKNLTEGLVAMKKGQHDLAKNKLEPLAKKGNAEAQYHLSHLLGSRGVPDITWLKKSAENGFVQAQLDLFWRILRDNSMATKDRKAQALPWLNKAVQKKNADAVFILAEAYKQGSLVKQDKAKAVELYQQASELGQADASHQLANIYHYGDLGQSVDIEKALVYYQRAGKQLKDKQKEASTEGDRIGEIALKFLHGYDVRKDTDRGIHLLQIAMEYGSSQALIDLRLWADNLYQGKKITQDKQRATDLYIQIAKQGDGADLEKLYLLAKQYRDGDGVTADKAIAIKLFKVIAQSTSEHNTHRDAAQKTLDALKDKKTDDMKEKPHVKQGESL